MKCRVSSHRKPEVLEDEVSNDPQPKDVIERDQLPKLSRLLGTVNQTGARQPFSGNRPTYSQKQQEDPQP